MSWEIGFVDNPKWKKKKLARRCKATGRVQFLIWKAGHRRSPKEDFWTDYDPSWWPYFKQIHPLCTKAVIEQR